MSDWQKVKVQFKDADGMLVSATMWARSDWPDCGYSRKGACVGVFLSWHGEAENVTVTPIRELPTGVGAVIRMIGYAAAYGDVRDVYISDQSGAWWSNNDGDCFSKQQIEQDGNFEVLSEGIQL